jgi:hypothetical protein
VQHHEPSRWKIEDLLTGFPDRGDGILIQTDIINIGMGSVFRFDRLDRMGIFQNRHLLLRIEKISKYPCSGGTCLHTGRLESRIDSVRTEGTLLNDLLNGMNVSDGVRTSHHAIPASDTGMGIDHDDPVFPFKRGMGRTNCDADGMVTVIAENGQKGLPHFGKGPFFNLFDPCWPYTEGNPVLHLAGHFTSMAADAPTKIYDHAIFDLIHLFPQGLDLNLIPFYFEV